MDSLGDRVDVGKVFDDAVDRPIHLFKCELPESFWGWIDCIQEVQLSIKREGSDAISTGSKKKMY